MNAPKNNNAYLSSEEFFYHSFEIESEWKKSQPRYTDKELLEIFPQAKDSIPEAILEWQEKHDDLAEEIKSTYSKVPEKDRWFYDILFERLRIPELLQIENHIFRLKRQLAIAKGPTSSGGKWENFQEMIDIAKTRSISELARDKLQLKPSGKNFVALCPFHNEKTPSCYFYTETNSFYCFGCNEKGDVIKFTMLFYGIGFREAVRMLQ